MIGPQEGLADDLALYLKSADAQVERVPNLELARERAAGCKGLVVWVVDAENERRPPDQMRAIAQIEAALDVRLVCVVIERGKRRRPRLVAPDVITVDGNALGRRLFLKVVAAAAGRASLEADTEGLLPIKVAATMPSREEALRRGRLILVAEDNETNQKVILRQLALLGHTADIVSDGIEALSSWRKGHYALLLTDLHMPSMDGYELTEAIRAEDKDRRRMPIVALTANVLKGEADHCRAVGMDDYCSKPIPLADLKAMLEKWLPDDQPEMNASTASGVPAPVTAQTMEAPVNIGVLKELVGDDPDMLREFLQDFRVSAAKIRGELGVAYASNQAAAAAAAAHKLKSSSRAVGAYALGELCAAIEEAGNRNEFDALDVLLPRFEAEMDAVEGYLNKQ